MGSKGSFGSRSNSAQKWAVKDRLASFVFIEELYLTFSSTLQLVWTGGFFPRILLGRGGGGGGGGGGGSGSRLQLIQEP